MQFCFYPALESSCGNIRHCPHLGGAAIGTLVRFANCSGQTVDQLDAERERNHKLVDENVQLTKELQQAKLELKLERQKKFATNQQKTADTGQETKIAVASSPEKKKGAPVGHPGWFRPTPTEFDWANEVDAPRRCPHCDGDVSLLNSIDRVEHLQEGIIDNVYRVVSFRHQAACCDECGRHVQQPGDGEILGSQIGPQLRSIAAWLRNGIGITYRKVPQIIAELYGVSFTPAALLGFETMLAEKSTPVVEDIRKKLATSGSRTDAGATRMAKLMTVAETSRRHGQRIRVIYYELYIRPPDKELRNMYTVTS